jgi:hypothetical protein
MMAPAPIFSEPAGMASLSASHPALFLMDAKSSERFWTSSRQITAYLKNGGKLEIAQQIAAHESSRTTGLYDRRDDDVNLDEVERIGI